MFDHAAAQAQIASCISYGRSAELSWQPSGGGAPLSLPAIIADAQPDSAGFDRNDTDEQCVFVTVARSLFGTTLPRANQVFSDAGGVTLRIVEIPKNPFAPALTYRCVAT